MKIGITNLPFLRTTLALVVISFVIVFLSACGIYFFEKDIQPELFGSLWHTIMYTLLKYRTIGYTYNPPVTLGGIIVSSLVSIVGTIVWILFLVNVIIGTIRTCSIIRRKAKQFFG